MNSATKTRLVNCPKCSGSGNLTAFGHIASGRCFTCGGAGKLETNQMPVSALKQLKIDADFRASWLSDSHAESGEILDNAWSVSVCEKIAADLLAIQDTAWSRKLLAALPAAYSSRIIAHGKALRASA